MLESPETYLLWLGVACYALLSGVLLSPLRHKYSFNRILLVLAIAVTCFALSIAIRWVRLDQGPFFTLYEILLSNLFSLGLVYTLIVSFSLGTRGGSPVVLPIMLLLGIWCIMESPEALPLPASYANNWLWAHVGLGKVFLGFCLAATGMAVVRLLRYAGRLTQESTAPSGELLIWKLMSAAFFFESLMLITGAVWANDAWGRYWSWDPLETWAFLTWLALAVLLHARFTFKSMPVALGWVGVVVVFSLAFLTFFGIPFFSMAPHKGIV